MVGGVSKCIENNISWCLLVLLLARQKLKQFGDVVHVHIIVKNQTAVLHSLFYIFSLALGEFTCIRLIHHVYFYLPVHSCLFYNTRSNRIVLASSSIALSRHRKPFLSLRSFGSENS